MTESTVRRPTVYDSAVDRWLVGLLILTPVLSALIGGYLIWIGKAGDATYVFLTGGLTALITIAFTVPCRYTILNDTLSIRCGIICYQVSLNTIEDIEKSSSLLSGPALSIRRVKVATKRRSHLISPKDREEFIRDLRKAVKQAKK